MTVAHHVPKSHRWLKNELSIRVCVFTTVILSLHVSSVTCVLGVPDPFPPVLSTPPLTQPPLTQPFTADWNRLCLRRSHGAVHCLAEWLNRAPSQVMSPRTSSKSAESTHRSTSLRERTASAPTSMTLLPQSLRPDLAETVKSGTVDFTTVHAGARSKCEPLRCL